VQDPAAGQPVRGGQVRLDRPALRDAVPLELGADLLDQRRMRRVRVQPPDVGAGQRGHHLDDHRVGAGG
jgi:hypothetical protein